MNKKKEIIEKILFWKPSVEIFADENAGIKLIGEIDFFNNHIEYQITDWECDTIHNSSYSMKEAIDMFCAAAQLEEL